MSKAKLEQKQYILVENNYDVVAFDQTRFSIAGNYFTISAHEAHPKKELTFENTTDEIIKIWLIPAYLQYAQTTHNQKNFKQEKIYIEIAPRSCKKLSIDNKCNYDYFNVFAAHIDHFFTMKTKGKKIAFEKTNKLYSSRYLGMINLRLLF